MINTIVVFNAGSSSLKFSVYRDGESDCDLMVRGQIERLFTAPRFVAYDNQRNKVNEREWNSGTRLTHEEAIRYLFQWGHDGPFGEHPVKAVGHRVAHGGLEFDRPTIVDDAVLHKIADLTPLAPLHQPHSVTVIRAVAKVFPDWTQVACFDTSFHHGHRVVEDMYALPRRLTEAGIRRYGFHGLSYEYIATRLKDFDPQAAKGRTIVAHLGSGASMCALAAGRSIATTMGFTALDGLPMGTRCGSLDPGVLLFLLDHWKMDRAALEKLLYHESGLLGVSEISNDMRTLLNSDDRKAAEAIDLFVYRIGRELGSLAAALGGLDALVFTAGIGQHAPEIRARVGRDAEWLGLRMDEAQNNAGGPCISRADSEVSAWVIPTDEELMIAHHTRRALARDE